MQKTERKRLIYNLGTPFSTVEWPSISQENQDVILELLCNFLKPIGVHRKRHLVPSKGKRARQRQRRAQKAREMDGDMVPELSVSSSSAPSIMSFVDVGASCITNQLQTGYSRTTPDHNAPDPAHRYAVVFVCRSGQSSAFVSHFPQMVAASTLSVPEDLQKTRLVGFSKACSDQLSAALGIPRVSFVGIRQAAPGAKALVDFVQQHVSLIDVPWLEEAARGEFRPTNINAIETIIGTKRQRTS